MLYDSGPMRLLEPFWTVALLGTLLSLWCLQQCMEWRTKPLVPTFVLRSQELFSGRSTRPRREWCRNKHRRKLNTYLPKTQFLLKQLNVQRTFKFLSSPLLSTFNNPVSQAVFQSLTSKLCGLKHFCEV